MQEAAQDEGATLPSETPLGSEATKPVWRRGFFWVAIAVAFVAWIAFAAYQTILGARLAQSGQTEITLAKQLSNASSVAKELPLPYLHKAEADFGSAYSKFNSWSLKPFSYLPVAGRQLRSLQGLSLASEQVSRIGIGAVTRAHLVLGLPHSAGPARINTLEQLISLANSTVKDLRNINLGPGNALLGPISQRRSKFTTELTHLKQTLSHASDAATAILRIMNGPSTYLVLVANNGEMRAGSGSFLDVGTVSAHGGYLSLGALTPSLDLTLPGEGVPVSGDMGSRWGWLQPGKYWINLGLSPQFPQSAELAAQMWQAATGQHVDGVMTLDVSAIKDLIEASGPIRMPNGSSLGANQVIQFLLHDQYSGLQSASQVGQIQGAREDLLGYLANTAFNQLQGSSVNLSNLSASLADSTTGRHIMLWSSDPTSEAAWTETGSGGATNGTSILASVINRGGNKLDQYLGESESLTISNPGGTVGTDGLPTAKLVVNLRNETPPGQGGYVAGPYPGLGTSYGEYVGYLALYIPGIASQVRVPNTASVTTEGKDGPSHLIAIPIDLLPGQSKSFETTFRLPYEHGSFHVVPSGRIPSDIWQFRGKQFFGNVPITLNW